MKKIILVCVLLVSTVSFAQEAGVLEVRNTNGQGWLLKDIIVHSDGTVTSSHLIAGPATESPPEVIANLSMTVMTNIESLIATVKEAPLVRTNPAQNYNPGGFGTAYLLSYKGGEAFKFAENTAGVDFGLGDSQSQSLLAILQGLDKLPDGYYCNSGLKVVSE